MERRISVSSNKSRHSRDSDLLNKLGQDKSKSSSKMRDRNNSSMNLGNSSSNCITDNSAMSEEESSILKYMDKARPPKKTAKDEQVKEPVAPPKIHNCVCFVAEECLSYNCNCFLSPLPCTPQCCPNCITLKSNLPLKISNACTCKKTRCLKLYCQCLAKGLYCSIMCRCELCQNHEHSTLRKQLDIMMEKDSQKGCSCKKSNCQKKYCECYAEGKKCTRLCRCTNCNNYTDMEEQEPQPPPQNVLQRMEIEEANAFEFEEPDFSFQPNKKRK